jgi:hypothetical protein
MNPGLLPLLSWLCKLLWDFTYLCWNLTRLGNLIQRLLVSLCLVTASHARLARHEELEGLEILSRGTD